MKHRTVILFLSHDCNRDSAAEYERICGSCSASYDVQLYFDESAGACDLSSFSVPPEIVFFDRELLFDTGYPVKGRNRRYHPGNQDLTILSYYLANPGYDFYWLIEHDVRFSGTWRDFFDAFADNTADLLGTSLRDRADHPGWEFWHTLRVPADMEIDAAHETIGFFPVLRLSNLALKTLHQGYRSGLGGHFEAVLPTLLRAKGLSVEDVGGDGPYVAAANRGRFYRNTPLAPLLSPGTFVFRPIRNEVGTEPDMLWHPVKTAGTRSWSHNRWASTWGHLLRRCKRLFSR